MIWLFALSFLFLSFWLLELLLGDPMPADPLCDCGTTDLVHDAACARFDLDSVADVAAQVAAEDGYVMSRAAIRHPSHAATRRHFKNNPFPRQQGAAA